MCFSWGKKIKVIAKNYIIFLFAIFIFCIWPLNGYDNAIYNKYRDNFIESYFPREWSIEVDYQYQGVLFVSDTSKNDLYLSLGHSLCDTTMGLKQYWNNFVKPRLNNYKIYKESNEKINSTLWKKAVIIENIVGAKYKKIIYYNIYKKKAHWIQFYSLEKNFDKNNIILEKFMKNLTFIQ